MLAVYESIDLGLVASLKQVANSPGDSSLLALLQANHPVFLSDPIHSDVIYVYHAFGVHSLDLAPILTSLSQALRSGDDEDDSAVTSTLEQGAQTSVRPILATFSIERKCVGREHCLVIPLTLELQRL